MLPELDRDPVRGLASQRARPPLPQPLPGTGSRWIEAPKGSPAVAEVPGCRLRQATGRRGARGRPRHAQRPDVQQTPPPPRARRAVASSSTRARCSRTWPRPTSSPAPARDGRTFCVDSTVRAHVAGQRQERALAAAALPGSALRRSRRGRRGCEGRSASGPVDAHPRTAASRCCAAEQWTLLRS